MNEVIQKAHEANVKLAELRKAIRLNWPFRLVVEAAREFVAAADRMK
jgi:hypothetical protein